jgi:hypothetical protein
MGGNRRARSNRGVVRALWVLVAYALILYAAFRWGTSSPDRFPGSD